MNPFARRTYGTLERVTERVYLFRNIVNSVIVLGDEAVALIDTQVNAPMAERLVQQMRTLSDKPLRYAINTHYHWDHTAGNHVCKGAGATVVSSALTRTFMATRSARQQAFLASHGFELGPRLIWPMQRSRSPTPSTSVISVCASCTWAKRKAMTPWSFTFHRKAAWSPAIR